MEWSLGSGAEARTAGSTPLPLEDAQATPLAALAIGRAPVAPGDHSHPACQATTASSKAFDAASASSIPVRFMPHVYARRGLSASVRSRFAEVDSGIAFGSAFANLPR